MKNTLSSFPRLIIFFFALLYNVLTYAQEPIRVALAGLSHDHVGGVLRQFKNGKVTIIGIAESNPKLVARIKKDYQLPDSLFYPDLSTLLKHQKPQAVMAFNAIVDHAAVVEACAPLGINVMVEKPLAVTVQQSERMASLARQYKIQLLTNYETTWYPSNQLLYKKIHDSAAIGDIRKMIVHDGHQGPREIGVSKEFFEWLTDPEKNGAGALVDFGCYGANLMTYFMNGQPPIAVTATVRHIKPDIYPKVEDDATIIVEYPNATGIIEASWNWPFGIKDFEVFGKTGYLQAVNSNTIRLREKENQPYTLEKLPKAEAPYQDYIAYLSSILRNEIKPVQDLSSLENNLIVVKILALARQSVKEGKRILYKN
jgi:predicted dehydrogenase